MGLSGADTGTGRAHDHPPPQGDAIGPSPAAAGSLRWRLLAAAAAWIAIALLLAGLWLASIFRTHVEQELAARVQPTLDQLVAALVVAPDGRLSLAREPADPQFRQPGSGLYWLIEPMRDGRADAGPSAVPGVVPLRSRSLWDDDLSLVGQPPGRPGRIETYELDGPRGQPLLAWARSVEIPGLATPLRVMVAADVSRQRQMRRSFGMTLAASLAALGAVLMVAVLLQVRSGLQPLRELQQALQALRAGRSPRVEGRFPVEVQPLVDEVNGLVAQNAAIVEQARTQTGNLAHALKTPLAVLGNLAPDLSAAAQAQWREQAERMREQIDRHLARSRAAALAQRRGPGTPVAAPLDDLRRALLRLHAARDIAIELEADPAARFRGDPADLQEMVGNLLDNAVHWARSRVSLRAHEDAGVLRIDVDDDGPGIAPADRAAVLERGRRLDERTPGSGLGLAIVDELARAHGGSIELDEAPSPLGGLRASLRLPAGMA